MNLALIDAAVAAYENDADEADRARLEFFKGLYALQQEQADLVAENGYEAPAPADARRLYWEFTPFFKQYPVVIDQERFAQVCTLVAEYLAANAGLDEAVAALLAAYDWKVFADAADTATAGTDPCAFIEDCLTKIDTFDVDAGIPATIFMMVPQFALRVFLQGPAESVMGSIELGKSEHKHDKPLTCPACGSPSTASYVGDTEDSDGRGRMQYCSTCGTMWSFDRIRCGCCGTYNQGHLHYFHIEGDDAHRLQNCDECGQYTRVVFQDDLGKKPLCMEVEDVVMARLDQVALDPRFRTGEVTE